MAEFAKRERDELLERARRIDSQLYPADREDEPDDREAIRLRETYYQVLGEYADRLPRVLMSACPFTGSPLLHSFDPWGVDGPWWHRDRVVDIDEPTPPPAFRVLLGGLNLAGRNPDEARETVLPGPEVPFVVPRLLELPGMVAVVSRLEMETGDVAYPIAYYSQEELPPAQLHQFWLAQDFWFHQEDGSSAWLIANDEWDFDLAPWVESGKVRWIQPGDLKGVVLDASIGRPCPYLNLAGDRFPQLLAFGRRILTELPDGTPFNPYED